MIVPEMPPKLSTDNCPSVVNVPDVVPESISVQLPPVTLPEALKEIGPYITLPDVTDAQSPSKLAV